jgi:hypothetical protein
MASILRTAAFALTLLPALALVQGAEAAPTPSPARAVEQRISALKSALAITPAEIPAWNTFAQTMRDNATATDALFAQRAATAATMSAVDNMHSYAWIARTYADNTEKLSAAFDTLYGQLSDTQKHAADVIFREQATAKK